MMKDDRKKLVFFFWERRTIVGSLLCDLRLAREIARSGAYDEVYYVNFLHPEIASPNAWSPVQLCNAETADYSLFEGADFVAALNDLCILLEKIRGIRTGRILLYDRRPDMVNLFTDQFYAQDRDVSATLRLFFDKKAVAFLDQVCCAALCKEGGLKRTGDPVYVPAFFSGEALPCEPRELTGSKRLNIGWGGGELDSTDNIHSLINLLDNLRSLDTELPVDIHIIGDGEARGLIDLKRYAPKIRFIFTSALPDEARGAYIAENIDLMVASGMSALDAANLSVPVVLPAVGSRPIRGDHYVFLFDAQGYSLGWEPEDIDALGYRTYTLSAAVEAACTGEGKRTLGCRCWAYCHANFTLENSARMLLQAMEGSALTQEDCWADPQIRRQMERCALYERLRPGRTYEEFALFTQRFNRLANAGLPARIAGTCGILLSPIPNKIKAKLEPAKKRRARVDECRAIQRAYARKAKTIREVYRRTGKLKALFLVTENASFAPRPMFKRMLEDPCFDPYIMVVPDVQRSRQHREHVYQSAYAELSEQYGDRVLHGWIARTDTFIEPGDGYQLAVFDTPYIRMAHPYHYLSYFFDKDTLTCYVDYGFVVVKYGQTAVFPTDFYNQVWKIFLDSEENRREVRRYAILKGQNTCVTGYVKMDGLAEAAIRPKERKLVIIAPHHTVMGLKSLDISNFLTYSELFIELPRLYPQIDFVFRPHPLLFSNLVEFGIWTKDEVDGYLARMTAAPNIRYDESGEYFELFANSDGMIHDCGSFMAEYLFTEKPCCYMLKSESQIEEVCNEIGAQCMKQYYKAYAREDILRFLDEVILKGDDPLRQSREAFSREVLKLNYPHASDMALKIIKDTLCGPPA